MSALKQKKLVTVTIAYWVMLLYMLAALAWWFIALEKQNNIISEIKRNEIISTDPLFASKMNTIEDANKRKTAQYIGEGTTFLALILVGAIFVFRATRRQLRLSEQQQNFMMAITHELKTPIAVTQLNLETLQKRRLDEEKQQKLISNTLQEANRLNTLCNNILFTSQLDAGKYASTMLQIDLTDLVESAVDDCKNRYPGRIFTDLITENIFIHGDAFLLQMLLSNLLENAIKYAPQTSPIQITLSKSADTIRLEVIDEGAGVADSEKKKVFDKFYRVGNENTRKAQGTGLGLYLCKRICDSHHAIIFVTNNQPKGSNFTVLFNA